jgi:hypothetical protein
MHCFYLIVDRLSISEHGSLLSIQTPLNILKTIIYSGDEA